MDQTDPRVAFIRARLDEDERAALAAKNETGRWQWSHGFGEMCNDPECPYGALLDQDEHGTVLMQVHGYDVTDAWQGAEHIARHDPARVLRDVAAKRKLLDAHLGYYLDGDDENLPIPTITILAGAWSDHDDYAALFQTAPS